MIEPVRQQLLDCLAEMIELDHDVRFGQLMDWIAFLVEDGSGQTLPNIDDEPLLEVMRLHRDNLARRRRPVS